MRIPFVNLSRLHTEMLPLLTEVFSATVTGEHIMGGETLAGFERAFAAQLGLSRGVGCGNGTDALEVILRALSIGPGDEVIVPANGWLSAAEVVLMLGATPVFAEPDPRWYTIGAAQVEQKITSRTRAVIPIHLYGLPAPVDAIRQVTDPRHIWVVEDCAQAHGARIGRQLVGNLGHAAAFSFYPTKNLGALGDAGMILTPDTDLADRCRAIANHGQMGRDEHQMLGRNSRMDTLQAAILQAKLPHVESWTERRRAIAACYHECWQELDLVLPVVPESYRHVYHLFVVRHHKRKALANYLAQQGIATMVHYPYALPQMPVFAGLSAPEDFPVACQQAAQLLSIPLYPELTDSEVSYIAEKVKAGVQTLQ